MNSSWLKADWPAPENVHGVVTTRAEGISQQPFAHNNLALHVGDHPAHVAHNRQQLAQVLGVAQWQWLTQVHGTQVLEVSPESLQQAPEADGAMTGQPGIALAILTADCLPVLLCDQAGSQIAAVHAGWRGLAAGIVTQAVSRFHAPPQQLMAYIGPAIGPAHFEVDKPVLEAFASTPGFAGARSECFKPTEGKPGHWQGDLAGLCRAQLHALGVANVYGGEHCSFAREDLFYSFRRDGQTGRMATLIWRD